MNPFDPTHLSLQGDSMKFSTFVFPGFAFLAAFALLNGSVLHLSTNLDKILAIANSVIK